MKEAPIFRAQSLSKVAGIKGWVLEPPARPLKAVVFHNGKYSSALSSDTGDRPRRYLSPFQWLFGRLSRSWTSVTNCDDVLLPLIVIRSRCSDDIVDLLLRISVRVSNVSAFVRWVSDERRYDEMAGAPRPVYPEDLASEVRELVGSQIRAMVSGLSIADLRGPSSEARVGVAKAIDGLVNGMKGQWGLEISGTGNGRTTSPTTIGLLPSRDVVRSEQSRMMDSATGMAEFLAFFDQLASDYGQSTSELLRTTVDANNGYEPRAALLRALDELAKRREQAGTRWTLARMVLPGLPTAPQVESEHPKFVSFVSRNAALIAKVLVITVFTIAFYIIWLRDANAYRDLTSFLKDFPGNFIQTLIVALLEIGVYEVIRRRIPDPVRLEIRPDTSIADYRVAQYFQDWRQRVSAILATCEHQLRLAADSRAQCADPDSILMAVRIRGLISTNIEGTGHVTRPMSVWIERKELGDGSWILMGGYPAQAVSGFLDADEAIVSACEGLIKIANGIYDQSHRCLPLLNLVDDYVLARNATILLLKKRSARTIIRPAV